MKNLLLTLALLTFASVATANSIDGLIDYKCQADCMAKGYIYQYCQRICSY